MLKSTSIPHGWSKEQGRKQDENKRRFESGATTYTNAVVNDMLNYAENYGRDSRIRLENMPEGAFIEDWEFKLEEITEEFICTPRYFLMCWLASCCLNKKMSLGEFPEFVYKPKGARKARKFSAVTREKAMRLSDEERNQYIEVFVKIASQNEGKKQDKGQKTDTGLAAFRSAFLWHKRERLLISKEEGLQIAHLLRMSYAETCDFLLRALEEDGLDFTTSEDIIHVYCLIRGKSYGVYKQLLAEYEESAKDIKKKKIKEKRDGFTEGMMPGSDSCTGKDVPGSLCAKISIWEEEAMNELLGKQAETQEAENVLGNRREKDSVDTKFMEWLLSQAEYLDIPSKSAWEIYRNLTAYVYKYTLDHHIRKRNADTRNFLETRKQVSTTGRRIFAGSAEMEDSFEDFEKDKDREEESSFAELDSICSKDSPYQFISGMDSFDYQEIVMKRLCPLFYILSDHCEINHMERLMRYTQVTPTGNLASSLIAERIVDLLAGEAPVTKADMLFMVWLVCNLYWSEKENEEGREPDMEEKIWGFLDESAGVLKEAHLPDLYIPHILERTFILSFCIKELGADDVKRGLPAICGYASTPIQVYLALGAFVNK